MAILAFVERIETHVQVFLAPDDGPDDYNQLLLSETPVTVLILRE